MKKNILFLGYNNQNTSLISFLKKKRFNVLVYGQKNLTKKILNKNFDVIISFGYRKIIKKNFLQSLKRPIINLHVSYLPFNRGSHPNFWSFIEGTPKGVSIHEINEIIDSGNLILRKKIIFKNIKNHTFNSTYKILITEIENLFKKNYLKIINQRYKIIKFREKGTYHSKKELPKSLNTWNVKILKYLKFYFK